jgi:hypothetical protein
MTIDDTTLSDDWYQSLVDDCRAIVTEAVFHSRWELIAGYHALGRRIVDEKRLVWNERGNGRTLSRVSKSTGIGERELYRAIQFYKKYPDINLLPNGKNISWHKITNELLPAVPDTIEKPNFDAVNYRNWYTKLASCPTRLGWDSIKSERFTQWHNAGKEFMEW